MVCLEKVIVEEWVQAIIDKNISVSTRSVNGGIREFGLIKNNMPRHNYLVGQQVITLIFPMILRVP